MTAALTASSTSTLTTTTPCWPAQPPLSSTSSERSSAQNDAGRGQVGNEAGLVEISNPDQLAANTFRQTRRWAVGWRRRQARHLSAKGDQVGRASKPGVVQDPFIRVPVGRLPYSQNLIVDFYKLEKQYYDITSTYYLILLFMTSRPLFS